MNSNYNALMQNITKIKDKSQVKFEDIKKYLPDVDNEAIASLLIGFLSISLSDQTTYNVINKILYCVILSIEELDDIEKDDFIDNLTSIYTDLLHRIRKSRIKKLNPGEVDSLKQAEVQLRTYLGKYKDDKSLESREFNYIWAIVRDIRAADYFFNLLKKQPAYINVYDRDMNSLLYMTIMEYLKDYDVYYLQIVAFLLEDANLIIKEDEIKKIVDAVQLDEETKSIKRLKVLLEHYFPEEKGFAIVQNAINTVVVPPVVEKPRFSPILDREDYIGRVDLTDLETISIDGFKYIGAKPKNLNIDDALSIDESDNAYTLYYHIADVPEYVSHNGVMNFRAAHMLENIYFDGLRMPIFDRNFISNYISLSPGLNRLAVTIVVKVDKTGKVLSFKIQESVICVDKGYTMIEANKVIKGKDNNKHKEMLNSLFALATLLRADITDEKSKSAIITEEMTRLVDTEVAKLCAEYKKPLIYKNYISHDNADALTQYSDLTEHTKRLMDRKEAQKHLEVFESTPAGLLYYSPVIIAPSLDKPYTAITNPERQYMSLENLRVLKKFIVHGEASPEELEYWKERLLHDCLIANSTNTKRIMQDPVIKKLLLNKN